MLANELILGGKTVSLCSSTSPNTHLAGNPVHRQYLRRIEYGHLRQTFVTGVGVDVVTLPTPEVLLSSHHVAFAHENFGNKQGSLGARICCQ
jgi:hypothetical protein